MDTCPCTEPEWPSINRGSAYRIPGRRHDVVGIMRPHQRTARLCRKTVHAITFLDLRPHFCGSFSHLALEQLRIAYELLNATRPRSRVKRGIMLCARGGHPLNQGLSVSCIFRNAKSRLAVPGIVERVRVCKLHYAAFQRVC